MSEQEKPAPEGRCNWSEDIDSVWSTACGKAFVFDHGGGPADNDMIFCCYCGKKLAQCSYQQEAVTRE